MAFPTRRHPRISYPPPPQTIHDSQVLDTSLDPGYSDHTLALSFAEGQPSFDQETSISAVSSQSTAATVHNIDDFVISPFSVLTTTPLPGTDGLGQTGFTKGSSSKPRHCNGSKPPKADPWTSVAVTGQPVMPSSGQQQLTIIKEQHKPPHTDSGYEGSLLSASMPVSRSVRKGHTSFQDDTMMAAMQQDLPDQQLPGSMTVPSLPVAKPRSSSTATTARPENPEGFHCSHCDLAFSTASEHQKHMARHEKRHKCNHPDCTRHAGFATSNDLDRHRRGVHNDIGLNDPVWKCFVDGCKSAEKTWPRQDNFSAHIRRMHPEVDVAQYIRISDEWFENEEKPRRQDSFAARTPDPTLNQQLSIGQFHQYSGAMTEQNYPASQPEQSEYASSVPGEYADSQIQHMWGMGTNQSVSQQYPNLYSPFLSSPTGLHPYASMEDTARGYSLNPAPSFSNMTHTGQQNDPPLPFAHRDNDFYESLRNVDVETGFQSYVKPIKARTLPDQERMNNPYFPDWQAMSYEATSPAFDIPSNNSQIELSFMGGDNTNPTIQFPEGDVLSSDTPPGIDIGIVETLQTAEQITDKNTLELQHEVAQLLSKCPDPQLKQKLKESIAKTIRDHATSSMANTGTTSGQGTTEASQDQTAPYQCSRPGCNKTFLMKNRLTKHEKRHDRIFFCTFDNCYKSFGTKTDLSRHEFRVHHQARAWRCWASNRTRDRNKQCALLFLDESAFAAHRKDCHSKIQWSLDAFKVEKDFTGAFWCGFCNAVVNNPVGVEVDGIKRVQHRYQHIEQHMNDIYHRSPGRDAMQDWYELAGEGKTKAEIKNNGQPTEEHIHEDEDSDDEDEPEGPASVSPVLPNRCRPRALTETKSKQGGRFLQVPLFPPDRKRPAEFATPNMPASQMFKVRKVQAPRSVAGNISVHRHSSVSDASSGTFQQPLPTSEPQAPNPKSIVAYIKCCKCKSTPRVNEGCRTCNVCFQPNCENCSYYNIDKQPLQVTLNRTIQGAK